MKNKITAEITISAEDGLLPGWVAARVYSREHGTVREFQVRVAHLLLFVHQYLAEDGAVSVWLKRGNGDPRLYTIRKKEAKMGKCPHPTSHIRMHVSANVQFRFLYGGIPSIAGIDYNGAVQDKEVGIECEACGKMVHPEIPISELTPELAQKLLQEED